MRMSTRRAIVIATVSASTMTVFAGTANAKRDPAPTTAGVNEAIVDAYKNANPGIPEARARAAAAKQDDRRAVYDALLENGGREYGGAWFEPTTGVLHVAVTSRGAVQRAHELGRAKDLNVETHLVRRSAADLEKQADAVRNGNDALSQAARGKVGIDVKTNQVLVAVPAGEQASVQAQAPEGVTVVAADESLQVEEDAGCTTRAACDYTIRAGAMLWRSSVGNNVCSVGFTARTSTNVRYTYTAGHCSNGNGVNWGTGGLSIGPMRGSRNTGAVDAAYIQVTNSWFTGDLGGEIYHPTAANRSLPLKGVAPTLSYIVAGESVCLSANFTNPGGPNYCGTVGTNSDPNGRGMVRVNGLDACPGDSGGGWYWMSSSGNRIAYGIHSNSNTGCHISGGRSWFSAMPTVKSTFTPGLNVEIR